MLQNQIVEFTWKTIKCWEVDETNGLFSFQFQREEKSPKCVKLHTPYVSILLNVIKNKLNFLILLLYQSDFICIFYIYI